MKMDAGVVAHNGLSQKTKWKGTTDLWSKARRASQQTKNNK